MDPDSPEHEIARDEARSPLGRFSTGVPGLDTILRGGPFRGTSNLIVGPAGAGKTLLAFQIAFHHVATGGGAVYATLLSESHARLLSHLSTLAFFDESALPDSLYLVSGRQSLAGGDRLEHLLELLWSTVRDRGATLFILDGIAFARLRSPSKPAFQKFLFDLSSRVSALGCTLFLLDKEIGDPGALEDTLADSVIHLGATLVGLRASRELHVSKLRGSDYLPGIHLFTLGADGVTVYPRTEAILHGRKATPITFPGRVRTGVARLDDMLRGGLPRGSTTALLGPTGSGKTILGLQYLAAGGRQGEPGVYIGFFEPPGDLVAKGDGAGLGLTPLVREGSLELLWEPSGEGLLDAIAGRLLSAVERLSARRVFLDGLDALYHITLFPERIPLYLIALCQELRNRGVTTLVAEEAPLGRGMPTIPPRLGSMTDNIILLRYLEVQARLRRLLSVLKVRESDYDSSLREFTITTHGIDIEESSESAGLLLAGLPPRSPVEK